MTSAQPRVGAWDRKAHAAAKGAAARLYATKSRAAAAGNVGDYVDVVLMHRKEIADVALADKVVAGASWEGIEAAIGRDRPPVEPEVSPRNLAVQRPRRRHSGVAHAEMDGIPLIPIKGRVA